MTEGERRGWGERTEKKGTEGRREKEKVDPVFHVRHLAGLCARQGPQVTAKLLFPSLPTLMLLPLPALSNSVALCPQESIQVVSSFKLPKFSYDPTRRGYAQ